MEISSTSTPSLVEEAFLLREEQGAVADPTV